MSAPLTWWRCAALACSCAVPSAPASRSADPRVPSAPPRSPTSRATLRRPSGGRASTAPRRASSTPCPWRRASTCGGRRTTRVGHRRRAGQTPGGRTPRDRTGAGRSAGRLRGRPGSGAPAAAAASSSASRLATDDTHRAPVGSVSQRVVHAGTRTTGRCQYADANTQMPYKIRLQQRNYDS